MASQQQGINRKRGRPTSLISQERVEADNYKYEQSLKNHQRTHAGEKPYQCTHQSCNKEFRKISQLKIHQKPHTDEEFFAYSVEGEKPHRCTYPSCNKAFRQISMLKTHQKRHVEKNVEGEKPHRCTYPYCGKAFRSICLLKTHHKCHTGEKSFICSAEGCLERFARSRCSCPIHPWKKLRKDGKETVLYPRCLIEEEIQWIKEYEKGKNNRAKKSKILPNRKHSNELKDCGVPAWYKLVAEICADNGFYVKNHTLYAFNGIPITRFSDTSITEHLPSSNPVTDVGDVTSMETVLHVAGNKTEEKKLPDLSIPVISLDDSLGETAVNLSPAASASKFLPTLNTINGVRRGIITKADLAVAREETPENILLKLPIKKRLLRTFNSFHGVRDKAEMEAALGLLSLNMPTR